MKKLEKFDQFLNENVDGHVDDEHTIECIKRNGKVFISATDLVKFIIGPDEKENIETFKEWLVQIAKAGS